MFARFSSQSVAWAPGHGLKLHVMFVFWSYCSRIILKVCEDFVLFYFHVDRAEASWVGQAALPSFALEVRVAVGLNRQPIHRLWVWRFKEITEPVSIMLRASCMATELELCMKLLSVGAYSGRKPRNISKHNGTHIGKLFENMRNI